MIHVRAHAADTDEFTFADQRHLHGDFSSSSCETSMIKHFTQTKPTKWETSQHALSLVWRQNCFVADYSVLHGKIVFHGARHVLLTTCTQANTKLAATSLDLKGVPRRNDSLLERLVHGRSNFGHELVARNAC